MSIVAVIVMKVQLQKGGARNEQLPWKVVDIVTYVDRVSEVPSEVNYCVVRTTLLAILKYGPTI